MGKLMTKKEIIAISNMEIIMRAKKDGLALYPLDLRINYAEMDQMITSLEDEWQTIAAAKITESLSLWVSKITKEKDLDPGKMDLQVPLQDLIMTFVRSVWDYGQQTADQEVVDLEILTNAERSGGKASGSDKTNDDAFEWYQLYTKELAKSTDKAVFHYMQPLILEHLDQGTVGTELASALEDDFKRFGQVRTKIIARTESNKAFNWGRRYRFDQSKAIAGYRYSAILDERTTDLCNALHGHSWTIDDPALDEHTPPNHYQCRSILVPISKYVTWTFDPPPAGWEADLPEKEKDVFEKFKDSSFYPKAETVKEKVTPKMEPPKAQRKSAPVVKKVATKKKVADPDQEKIIQDMINLSNEAAAKGMDEFVESNKKRGIPESHPALAGAIKGAEIIRSGHFSGIMISTDWNAKKKQYEIQEYTRRGNVFWRKASSSIKAADRDRMLQEIDQVADDPLFLGVKFELIKSSTKAGSYSPSMDVLQYEVNASKNSKRQSVEGGELGTLYHEVGHRVHNTTALYKSEYQRILTAAGINISDEQWKEWEKLTDPFYENSYTQKGTSLLPDDLALRYEYPINAKYYYKNGTKANFYKEMFAETSAVYLENIESEFDKVERNYPGLLGFLESVYQREYFKISTHK